MRIRRLVAPVLAALTLLAQSPTFAAPPQPAPAAQPEDYDPAKFRPKEAIELEMRSGALVEKGQIPEALKLLERSRDVLEKKLGKDHLEVGRTTYWLATLHDRMRDDDGATKLVDRAISILLQDPAVYPDELARALDLRARLYERRDDLEHAISTREMQFALILRRYRDDSPEFVSGARNLAALYAARGRYDDASPLYDHVLAMAERAHGPDDPALVEPLEDLAKMEFRRASYQRAEVLFRRALAILEKAGKGDGPDAAHQLNNVAETLFTRGDYAGAEPLYERALRNLERTLGPDSEEVGIVLNNIATLRLERGDAAGSVPLLRRALALREKALGPDDLDLVANIGNLGEALSRAGQEAQALPLFERAVAIREKHLAPDHPLLAFSRYNLATVRSSLGQTDGVEETLMQVLAAQEKALGAEHPALIHTLHGLGVFAQERKDLAAAEALGGRALAVTEKSLGPRHPLLVMILKDLATVHDAAHRPAEARADLARAGEVAEQHTALVLAAGSEPQKLAFLETLEPLWEETLRHHLRYEPNNPEAARLALTATLRRKGRVLDAVAGDLGALRRKLSPEDQALFNKLRDAQRLLAANVLRGPGNGDPAAFRASVDALGAEVEKLSSEVSKRSAAFRAASTSVTVAAVQAALDEGSAYVEIVQHDPDWQRKGARYTAYLLRSTGDPIAVELGDAGPIDNAVLALRQALAEPTRKDVEQLSRALDERVTRPIRDKLGDARTLYLAPDGALNLIPFEALRDEQGHYAIERWSISYLTSGRDFLRFPFHAPSRSGPAIFADPAFGEVKGGGAGKRGLDATDIARMRFPPLEGTADEGRSIASRLPGARLRMGAEASKAALIGVSGPRILHVATHGFFMGEPAGSVAQPTRGLELEPAKPRAPVALADMPLLRSGLALSGANAAGGEQAAGILTALEATGLDLDGTKLVVLSACETGLGEVVRGEGVEGLRRALVLAGAETTVMSLWKVDDAATRDMMIDYYGRLEAGEGRSEALRQVRLAMLKDPARSHPFYWASFIVAGDPSRIDGSATRPAPPRVPKGARGCACHVAGSEDGALPGALLGIVVLGAFRCRSRQRRSVLFGTPHRVAPERR
jgi:CHAT domain-containing protein